MQRTLALTGLAVLGMAAATVPAAAFWPRSQWLACSEAATHADYQRWRCWELDGYAGAIAPPPEFRQGPGSGSPLPRAPRRSVSRLG